MEESWINVSKVMRGMEKNLIVFGDARNMKEVDDNGTHPVVTLPPYFNAPSDYPDLFENHDEFLT